jgi:penicillin amidase
MARILRWVARVFTGLGILILLLLACVGGALWLTLPPHDQTVQIPGLSAPVEIGFDADGIPRIKAANEADAAAALGYVHARDRMFQMELMRRAASGRLSEIAGPATLRIDRLMRTLGLRNHAAADLAALPADTRALIDAYARGVNAWIAQRGRFAAPEFLVLGAPEAWQPVDTLLWAKTMGLWLSLNWRTELDRLALAGKVPQPLIDQLWPPAAGPDRPDARRDTPERYADAVRRLESVLPHFPDPFTLPPSASNEWAVDGSHTATGAPLLAGDPHLAFGFPGIWYLARIELPDSVLAGATAPGVPFLVLGRNSHIAWTFTTTGADVQDVFIETPAGPGAYQTPDGPQPFTVREERIKVRGQPDQMLTVRETRHGPVISDLDPEPGNPLLAVAMGNLQPNDSAAAGLLALNRASSVAEAGQAAALISSPVQNLLVADAKGIGLFVTGKVPIRKAGDGAAPVPGNGQYDWTGWAAGEQLPHYVAPPDGRLVNANEPVAPPDFPVFMGRDQFGDWRARRIRTLLGSSNRLTVSDFTRMQTDVLSPFAQQILPVLTAVPGLDGPAAQAQSLLKGWDGAMTMDAPQPLIFNAWVRAFYDSVLHQAGISPYQGGPRPDFVAYVLSPAGAHWCQGDCTPLLRQTLEAAVRDLTGRFGADPAAWRWGNAHVAVFANPLLSHLPIVGGLTTIRIPSPGDDTTVDRGGTNAALESVHGAAFRGVYDLADLDRSRFVVTPGQSGNPLSAHARDFVTRWRDGATVTLGPLTGPPAASIRLLPAR